MSYQLINRSAHDTGLAPGSVHCVVCSPPYFGLRSYSGDQGIECPTMEYAPMPGLPPIRIQGCEPGCEHEWVDGRTTTAGRNDSGEQRPGFHGQANGYGGQRKATQGAYCIHCQGWRGALGLEPTIEAYIGHLILVLRELHRILRPEGTVWWNLGDSFSSGSMTPHGGERKNRDQTAMSGIVRNGVSGLKPKNLCLIPARFALAAQADGWIVRSAMPWIKRNGMPESVTDRPAQVVESIFLLAKSEKYFFDMQAVSQPSSESSGWAKQRQKGIDTWKYNDKPERIEATGQRIDSSTLGILGQRNFRSSDLFFKTWQGLLSNDDGDPLAMVVNPRSYTGSHFAVFPELIPEIAIKAGSSQYGCCAKCQAPWERVVERERIKESDSPRYSGVSMRNDADDPRWRTETHTTGWAPTCQCNVRSEIKCGSCQGAGIDVLWAAGVEPMSNEDWSEVEEDHPCPVCDGTGKQLVDAIPATVLDPFSGSGTTGRAALALGRSYIGVDLSQEYLDDLAPARLSNVQIEMAF